MKIIILNTRKNGMYNLISLCGYSLKINMILKYTTMKNVIFTATKSGTNLIMGTHQECSRYSTTEYDKGAFLIPRPCTAFLKTVNNNYVKINENKNVSYPKRNS